MSKKKEILQNLLKLAGIVFAATILGKIFAELGFPETNIVVMYLLAVFLVARFTAGYQYGILSAITSLVCYNYFFTEPYHTLAVNDPSYLITFFIMLVTSFLTSALTTKEKLLMKEANEREKERLRDRENMERERERANLLRAISHDLRTPLSGIMGTSEMLMDMTEKEDRRQELLLGIYQDADWLKSLVENILSLTRLQDGKILIHKEMEAIEEVIGCAVAHVERSFPERVIQVETPEDFRLVPMDAKLMEQVITNLLDNAVKHTKPEETITVSASYTENTLSVSVRDEGEGIAEEDIPNLFQIFYTSKNRSADVKRGIGLGLTICETVINAHGGTIIGRNRTDGKGAEFLFTLPLTEGEKENV